MRQVVVLAVALSCGKPTLYPDPPSVLDANRDRLLATYLERLRSIPEVRQSNGLVGRELETACDLWDKLDPSSRGVFLTITHRLGGSKLGVDGSTMLDHVVALYRVSGGRNASDAAAGSCGGFEYNRMFMSMDKELHAVLVAANSHRGKPQLGGARDISDIRSNSYWRESRDLLGPHKPFDQSDETEAGAPRGQTQFFRDPLSALAHKPLGRLDVSSVIDPFALEMDQDYDCIHHSNPSCSYIFYGRACLPRKRRPGAEIYTRDYGDYEADWKPSACR
jgi:hypothetical protein